MMATYTLAEAQSRLIELVERALRGESVVVADASTSAVQITAVPRQAKRAVSVEALEWLEQRRRSPRGSDAIDSGALVSAMRDEDEA